MQRENFGWKQTFTQHSFSNIQNYPFYSHFITSIACAMCILHKYTICNMFYMKHSHFSQAFLTIKISEILWWVFKSYIAYGNKICHLPIATCTFNVLLKCYYYIAFHFIINLHQTIFISFSSFPKVSRSTNVECVFIFLRWIH